MGGRKPSKGGMNLKSTRCLLNCENAIVSAGPERNQEVLHHFPLKDAIMLWNVPSSHKALTIPKIVNHFRLKNNNIINQNEIYFFDDYTKAVHSFAKLAPYANIRQVSCDRRKGLRGQGASENDLVMRKGHHFCA
jgi:hypothetical protein